MQNCDIHKTEELQSEGRYIPIAEERKPEGGAKMPFPACFESQSSTLTA